MRAPECCEMPMWLHSVEDVVLRGGWVSVRMLDEWVDVEDALLWECMGCGEVEVIAVLTYGIPGPLGQDGAA